MLPQNGLSLVVLWLSSNGSSRSPALDCDLSEKRPLIQARMARERLDFFGSN
jgi:hypothetical protein